MTFDPPQRDDRIASIAPAGGPSLSEVLFGDRPPPVGGEEPDNDRVDTRVETLLSGITLALRTAAQREVMAALRSALGSTVFDVVYDGWQKHQALVAAGHRTLSAAGTIETLEVATHHIGGEYQPGVDVVVDGVRVGTVNFSLQVEVKVAALLAVVTMGRLVAVRSGHADFTVMLEAEGQELATGTHRAALDSELSLGDGLPLASL